MRPGLLPPAPGDDRREGAQDKARIVRRSAGVERDDDVPRDVPSVTHTATDRSDTAPTIPGRAAQ